MHAHEEDQQRGLRGMLAERDASIATLQQQLSALGVLPRRMRLVSRVTTTREMMET